MEESVFINQITDAGNLNKVTKGNHFFNVNQESGLETQIIRGLDSRKTNYIKIMFKAEKDFWIIYLIDNNNDIVIVKIDIKNNVDHLLISTSKSKKTEEIDLGLIFKESLAEKLAKV